MAATTLVLKMYNKVNSRMPSNTKYYAKRVPEEVVQEAIRLSDALREGGIGKCVRRKKEALQIQEPLGPVCDYLRSLLQRMTPSVNVNLRKLQAQIWNHFEYNPATVDWLLSMKKNDNSFRFSLCDVVSILKMHDINSELTEELIEAKNKKGEFVYDSSDINKIITLTSYNPSVVKEAKRNPSGLFSALNKFISRTKIAGYTKSNGEKMPIYKKRFSNDECGALLNAYCINKPLTLKLIRNTKLGGFAIEDYVKNQAHSAFNKIV